jgi:ankyrin repeat protein
MSLTPLIIAVLNEDTNRIKSLIKKGVDVNQQIVGNGPFGPSIHGHTALSIAMIQKPVSVEPQAR